jgi:hypothetical protein
MGTYTEHWKQYRKRNIRGVVYVLLMLVIGLPVTALISLGVEQLTGEYPAYLHVGLIVIWLVVFTMLILRYSRVLCPRCGTQYTHGRGLADCPKCGLKMLQEDP